MLTRLTRFAFRCYIARVSALRVDADDAGGSVKVELLSKEVALAKII